MKRFFLPLLFLILYSLFFLLLSPVSAQITCDQEPDVVGPWYNRLFTDESKQKKDCGTVTPYHPRWADLISQSTVECIPASPALLKMLGDPSLLSTLLGINNTVSGQVEMGSDFIANWDVSSDALAANPAAVYNFGFGSSYFSNRGDTSRTVSDCYADPLANLNDPNFFTNCVAAKGTALYNSLDQPKVNTFNSATEFQRTTSIVGQLQNQCRYAKIYLDCKTNPSSHDNCSNWYYTKDQKPENNEASTVLANFIQDSIACDGTPDQIRQSYNNLPDQASKIRVMALKPPKTAVPIIFVFIPRDPPSWEGNWLTYTLRGYNPADLWGYAPISQANATVEGEINSMVKLTDLDTGQALVDEVLTPRQDPIPKVNPNNGSDIYFNQLLAKIKAAKTACGSQAPIQSSGAATSADSTKPALFSFLLDLFRRSDGQQESQDLFTAYAIIPPEVNAQSLLAGLHPNAKSRALQTRTKSEQFVRIDSPLSTTENSQGNGISEKVPNGETIQCPRFSVDGDCLCPGDMVPTNTNDKCERTETAGISLNPPGTTSPPGVKAGETVQYSFLSNIFRRYRPLDSPERIDETCYEAGYNRLTGGLSRISLQTPPQFQQTESSSCYDPLAPVTSTQPEDGNVCAIAAQYNLPCCFLQGIQRIESGCDPTTNGINTFGNLNCCNPLGYCGPMQIGAGIVHLLANRQNLNACDVNDSYVLASRLLIRKQCQAWGNLCDRGLLSGEKCTIATRYNCTASYQWYPDMLNEPLLHLTLDSLEEVVGDYYGTCSPEEDTLSRGWGNVGYCDVVNMFCTNNLDQLPIDLVCSDVNQLNL